MQHVILSSNNNLL